MCYISLISWFKFSLRKIKFGVLYDERTWSKYILSLNQHSDCTKWQDNEVTKINRIKIIQTSVLSHLWKGPDFLCCPSKITNTQEIMKDVKNLSCHVCNSLSSSSLQLSVPPSYLQPQSHFLGDGRLGEDGLDVGHQLTDQPAALRTNQIALLLNAGDHSEVEGEVGGDDPTDSLLVQLVVTLQVYTQGGVTRKKRSERVRSSINIYRGNIREQGKY